MAKSKNYRAAKALVTEEFYTLKEACDLIPQTSKVKFDASVEIHVKTGLDPKHADQILRFTTPLPHGTGKKLNVVAFVPDDMVADAKKAGASEAGLEDLVDKISKGWMDFDMAVAHPSVMKNLGKVAKQLGQARKMPSPKAGTIGEDVPGIVADIMKGKVEVRTDKAGCIHNIVGKVSFGADNLYENIKSLVEAIKDNKPSGSKGMYIKSITLATSMGPGVPVDINAEL
jgi:large subunit ribosomal protein L1